MTSEATDSATSGERAIRRVGIIAFTRKGCALAMKLAEELGSAMSTQGRVLGMTPAEPAAHTGCISIIVSGPARFTDEFGIEAYDSLASWTADHFIADDALVFVGAAGIAVRAIAPHVHDKFTDPAVVSVDEAGRFAVPLLSGHVGGANDLARAVAAVTGGQAVVSTATDVNGLFAVDEWAARNGLAIVERALAKEVSAALLEGRPVGFAIDGHLDVETPFDTFDDSADLGFAVSLDDTVQPFARTLHLVPRAVTVGVGCRKGVEPSVLAAAVDEALARAHVSKRAVKTLATIDVKRGEVAIEQLAVDNGWQLIFYTAEELAAVPGDFTASEFVKNTVGVDNVCERAALAQGGTLLAPKQAHDGTTVALARMGQSHPYRSCGV